MRRLGRGRRVTLAAAGALAAVALVPPVAGAADYTWTGAGGTASANWSNPANWSGGVAPANGETIGTLTFPAPSAPCSASPSIAPCSSVNDLTGLTVGSLDVSDAVASDPRETVIVSGNPITLTGGVSSSPGGPPPGGVSVITTILSLPIALGAPQTWTVAGYPPTGNPLGSFSGLSLGTVTGAAYPLTLRVSDFTSLLLSGDNEVGPMTVTGADPARSGLGAFSNGALIIAPSTSGTPPRLNATDGNAVTITDAQLDAGGDFGPLTLHGGDLVVGVAGPGSVETVSAATLSLDRSSSVSFRIIRSGTAAGADYSQLRATGPVALGGAKLSVGAGTAVPGDACPNPRLGTTYTLVTTTGTLTGTFDVPAGTVLPVGGVPPQCRDRLPFGVRIDYHPQSVTATVVPAPPPGVRPGVAGASRVSGTVQVRRPGRKAFTRLRGTKLVPTGSELDTIRGRVRLFVASRKGGTAIAELYGGRFVFRQPRRARPRTTFVLSQPLTGCRRASSAAAVASRRRRRHRARHVWVTEEGGSFDTRGQFVGTSVQGTTWLTGDTCTTSIVKVKRGTVTVHDLIRDRTVKLHAGQTYTARKHR
jgi:hypothetical protein